MGSWDLRSIASWSEAHLNCRTPSWGRRTAWCWGQSAHWREGLGISPWSGAEKKAALEAGMETQGDGGRELQTQRGGWSQRGREVWRGSSGLVRTHACCPGRVCWGWSGVGGWIYLKGLEQDSLSFNQVRLPGVTEPTGLSRFLNVDSKELTEKLIHGK